MTVAQGRQPTFGRPWTVPGLGALLSLGVASLAALSGAFLALHHPLSPGWAVAGFILACVAAVRDRTLWLLIVPAAVPLLSFAPWTGWLTFEEIDLLILAVAAGGYARQAFSPSARPAGVGGVTVALAGLGVGLLVAAMLVSMQRGFADAGGFEFGWYQGYHEPMNSLRIAKGPLLAALLWPLWLQSSRAEPAVAAARLRAGLTLGLLAASLAALWERVAFTGLLNGSSNYRTTALFWEMHVGGAALDGFLALTFPFALAVLLRSRRPLAMAAASAVFALGVYACLTTFSRDVYLGVPVGLAVFAGLVAALGPASREARRERLAALILVGACTGAVAWMFPSSGYRGALALLVAFGAVLATSSVPSAVRVAGGLGSWGSGVAAAVALLVVGVWLPKGPYLADTLAGLLVVMASVRLRPVAAGRVSMRAARWMLSAAAATLALLVQVARYWGGEPALWRALPVAAGLFALLVAGRFGVRWPSRRRWQAGVLGITAVAAYVVAVFFGGAYMAERFSTASEDFETRIGHWRDGLAMLSTPGEWWLGRGLGRYPGAYYIAQFSNAHSGDYRLKTGPDGQPRLVLSASQQAEGFGEILRFSQRIAAPGLAPRLRFDVLAKQAIALHVEVCEKHLLYNGACQVQSVYVKAGAPDWQPVDVRLDGNAVSRGDWFAPRQIVFSIALGTPGAVAEVARLRLADARGVELLANGDFSDGLAQWFFSSDHDHLPWHAKNMALALLIDGGIVGLGLVTVVVALALARLSIGPARRHPLAPVLAASLCGFVVVGLFDSLIDAPRVAVVFYLLTFIGLSLPEEAGGPVD